MYQLLYHHSCPLSAVRYGTIRPRKLSSLFTAAPQCVKGQACELDWWHYARSMKLAYEWLAGEVSFYPLFLAVGATEDDRCATGYQSQFKRPRPGSQKSEPRVLFSYEAQPTAPLAFNDYDHWHSLLSGAFSSLENLGGGRHTRTLRTIPQERRDQVLKPDWSSSRWLRQAGRAVHTVQAVVPALDLRAATRIWVPNVATRDELLRQGFAGERVEVHRLGPGSCRRARRYHS